MKFTIEGKEIEIKDEDILNNLKETGFRVRTEQEEQEFLTRFKDTQISEYSKSQWETVENAVKEVAGVEKVENEKATDYLKRAFSEKLKGVEELNKQLEELKKDGDKSGVLKAEIEKIQAEAAQKIAEATQEKEQLLRTIQTEKLSNSIQNELSELRGKYNKDLDDNIIKGFEANILNQLNPQSIKEVEQDGKKHLILLKEDGTPMVDGEFKQVTVKSFLENALKPIFGEQKQQNGAGTKPPSAASPQGKESGLNFDGVKSVNDLTTLLSKKGLRLYTESYDQAYAEGLEHIKKLTV